MNETKVAYCFFHQNGKESMVTVIINVLDENDNVPRFHNTEYLGHISESAHVGTVVLMSDNRPLVVSATDLDSEQNSNLVYSILQNEALSTFSIDSTTGAIRSIAPLDREVIAEYNFTVAVRDSGTPRLSSASNAHVSISITDVNDVAPRFLEQEYSAMVLLPTHK